MGAGKPGIQRPRNDRRFPPPGVTPVPSYGWPPYKGGVAHGGGARGGASPQQPQRSTLRGQSPPRCGPGCARESALEAGWHGLPESSAVKRSAAPACVVRASPGASWRRTGGGGSGGSDPLFLTAGAAPGRGRWCTPKSTTSPPLFGVAPSAVIPGGKASRRAFALMEGECLLCVALCSFVACLLLYVSLCVFLLHRVPLHIRVSPETRQGLQRLRTQRHLNVGSWLRALVDEALEGQQTTNGPEAEKGKPGGCSQPDISDPNPGAAYHPARRSRTQSLGGCNIVRPVHQ